MAEGSRTCAADIFRKVVARQGCIWRGDFPLRKAMRMADVSHFDEAVGWCLERHRRAGGGFRVWTQPSRRSAIFELERDIDAVEFQLIYG